MNCTTTADLAITDITPTTHSDAPGTELFAQTNLGGDGTDASYTEIVGGTTTSTAGSITTIGTDVTVEVNMVATRPVGNPFPPQAYGYNVTLTLTP